MITATERHEQGEERDHLARRKKSIQHGSLLSLKESKFDFEVRSSGESPGLEDRDAELMPESGLKFANDFIACTAAQRIMQPHGNRLRDEAHRSITHTGRHSTRVKTAERPALPASKNPAVTIIRLHARRAAALVCDVIDGLGRAVSVSRARNPDVAVGRGDVRRMPHHDRI